MLWKIKINRTRFPVDLAIPEKRKQEIESREKNGQHTNVYRVVAALVRVWGPRRREPWPWLGACTRRGGFAVRTRRQHRPGNRATHTASGPLPPPASGWGPSQCELFLAHCPPSMDARCRLIDVYAGWVRQSLFNVFTLFTNEIVKKFQF